MTSVTVTLKARSVEVQWTEFSIYLTVTVAHVTLTTLNVYIKIDYVAHKYDLKYNPIGVKICKYYQ